MNKLVYLSELDSTVSSKDKKRLKYANSRIFEEIIINVNTIVLSLNQLVDSPIIISAINNNKTYSTLKKLVENKKIIVDIYKYTNDNPVYRIYKNKEYHIYQEEKNYSIINYLVSNLKKEEFILTNLPFKADNRVLKEALLEAFLYNSTYSLHKLKNDKDNTLSNSNYEFLIKYIDTMINFSIFHRESDNSINSKNITYKEAIRNLKIENIMENLDISKNTRSSLFSQINNLNLDTLEKSKLINSVNIMHNYVIHYNMNISYYNLEELYIKKLEDKHSYNTVLDTTIHQYKVYKTYKWSLMDRYSNIENITIVNIIKSQSKSLQTIGLGLTIYIIILIIGTLLSSDVNYILSGIISLFITEILNRIFIKLHLLNDFIDSIVTICIFIIDLIVIAITKVQS